MQKAISRFTFGDAGVNFPPEFSGTINGNYFSENKAATPGVRNEYEQRIRLDEDNTALAQIDDTASEFSNLARMIYITGANESKNLKLNYHHSCFEGARSEVYILKNVGAGQKSSFDIQLHVDKNAELTVYFADLGGVEHALSLNADLAENARLHIKSIYLGEGDQKLDYNYRVDFHGKNAFSDLDVNGALLDRSQKIFRGSMDFKMGSSGSEGSEVETVTLLSDDARNITVPLLLCTEDDVMGNHAASIGKIDQQMLFYLQSRGIKKSEAEKMIILSRFNDVLDAIKDQEIRDALEKRVEDSVNPA